MTKFKKSLSVLTSAAIAASMLSAFTVTAGAKTDIISESFDDASTVGSYWSVVGTNVSTSVDEETSRLMFSGYNGNNPRTATVTLPSTTGDAEYANIKFDFAAYSFMSTNYGAATGIRVCDASGNIIFTLYAPNAHSSATLATINGVNLKDVVCTSTDYPMYTIDAIADFVNKTVNYSVTAQGSDLVLAQGTTDFASADASNIGSLVFSQSRNSNYKVYLDNFSLVALDAPIIELAEDTSVAEGGSTAVATVTGVENDDAIEASSGDESIITVSVENGVVTAQYVGSGKTTVTIKATSPDGVSVTKTVDVIAGSVELTEVAVKYVDYENNEIAEGYTISEVPVGTVLKSDDVNYENTVLTDSYRYTNPSVADYTAVSGENTLYVRYADKAAAVNEITISYQADGNEVASKTEELAEGLYVGDSYTYYSTSYVTAEDGTIYAVGVDFTEDADSVVLNNASNPINSIVKKTVTLMEDTTINYDAVKSPNAVFYSEWENIFSTSTWGLDGRYVASGSKVTSTTSRVGFYEVPATGYYQIIVVGGTRGRGVAVYSSEEAAEAATAIDDGTALLTYKGANNTAYGLYTAKTALLTEGNMLTIRGFGNNNTTDDLDYVVVRRIVSGNIIGSDGVSIIPGGQTSAYTFDSGLSETPTWSVTGVDGVTIDENGVLTVAETASEGTAIVKAEMASAGVSGTKEVTIEKAQIADFIFNAPVVISLGGKNTYSISDVTDQFGVKITPAATAVYESDNGDVMAIDPAAGVAEAKALGTSSIKVTVSVGNETSSKTQSVTVKSLYLAGVATGDETTVTGASALVTSANITGYIITTAKDGTAVRQTEVTEIPETIDTTGADSYEIDPIYTYNSLSGVAGIGYTAADLFADGFYNMTFTKGDKKRADIYVNDYMVGNNVDQYGEGRSIAGGTEYTIHDAVVTGGAIKITTTDRGGDGSISKAVIVKAPSNVTRKPKLYVTGDSLVADYYGTYPEGTEVGGARTGWGQQLHNFITDDMEVVNLANSGQYAAGLLTTAFPGIIAMAQPGDWFVLESGYNDRNYSNTTEMYNSVVEMVEKAEEKDLNVVLVSPNASAHDYKSSVMYASTMTKAAEDMMAKYDNIIYVDLSKLSYNFMMSTGISTTVTEAAKMIEVEKDEAGLITSISMSDVAANGNVKMPKYGTARYYTWNAIDGETAMKPVAAASSTAKVVTTYNLTSVGGDTLHSSYAGAMKWAEIVAQGMKDAGADFINTKFSYNFTDTIGNEITCQVK